jgi:hypothetical protein
MSPIIDPVELPSAPISPEQRLFIGVIANAVMEAKGAWRADAARGRASQTRESARAWFTNGGEDFAAVCTLAGYCPRQVRDGVLAYLDRLDADPNHAIDMRRSRRKASSVH